MLGARAVVGALLALCVLLQSPPAGAQDQAIPDRKAVVFIEVECEDAETGARTSPRGSGYIFEKSGLILTAFHVVACKSAPQGKQQHVLKRSARIGSPHDPTLRPLDLLAFDDHGDVALLKFMGMPQQYPSLNTCALRDPPTGLKVMAAGFPEGNDFQPTDGIIGNTSQPSGRWALTSAFAPGMSGGPVAHNGYIIGIMKGGVGDNTALRSITPIYKASYIAQSETGQLIPPCQFAVAGLQPPRVPATPQSTPTPQPAPPTPPKALPPTAPPPAAKSDAVETIRKLPNTYVEGTGYLEKFGMTYAACEQMCLTDARCRQMEFYRPKNGCNLFDSIKASGTSRDADVGIKVAAAAAPPVVAAVRNADMKLWDHNGSTMTQQFSGERRRFIYHEPKSTLVSRGVKRGTVLFDGMRSGPNYVGKSKLFRGAPCGEISYDVEGPVSSDQKTVILRGRRPIVDASCAVTGFEPEELVFKLIE